MYLLGFADCYDAGEFQVVLQKFLDTPNDPEKQMTSDWMICNDTVYFNYVYGLTVKIV